MRDGLPWYLHGTVCVGRVAKWAAAYRMRTHRPGGKEQGGDREVGRGGEGARVLLAARARACVASRADAGERTPY